MTGRRGIDDAQPPRPQDSWPQGQAPLVIWATVNQPLEHPIHKSGIRRVSG